MSPFFEAFRTWVVDEGCGSRGAFGSGILVRCVTRHGPRGREGSRRTCRGTTARRRAASASSAPRRRCRPVSADVLERPRGRDVFLQRRPDHHGSSPCSPPRRTAGAGQQIGAPWSWTAFSPHEHHRVRREKARRPSPPRGAGSMRGPEADQRDGREPGPAAAYLATHRRRGAHRRGRPSIRAARRRRLSGVPDDAARNE
jgi:hypothetical protein